MNGRREQLTHNSQSHVSPLKIQKNMTLKDLIKNNTWLSVSSTLTSTYPDQAESLEGFKAVFEKLLAMEPEETDLEITIEYVMDGDHEYVDVSGKHKYPKTEEEKYSQAIEFSPWRQWLGMEISTKSLHVFSELQIIAHCLWEMTFMGFEEREIQNKLREIDKDMHDYQSLTEEEKKEYTISLAELWDDEDIDEDEDEDEPLRV